MEQMKTPESALSLMQSWLLPMLKHVQRQQNALHLHHSLYTHPLVLHPTFAAAISCSCVLYTATAILCSCALCTTARDTCLYNALSHTTHIWIPVPKFSASILLPLFHVFILHIPFFYLDNFSIVMYCLTKRIKHPLKFYRRSHDTQLSEKKMHNKSHDEANSPVSGLDPSFGHDQKGMRKYYVIQH